MTPEEEIKQLKSEVKLLHQTIARLTESHQEEMKTEIAKQQRYLDQLAEKVDKYTDVINIHKELGK